MYSTTRDNALFSLDGEKVADHTKVAAFIRFLTFLTKVKHCEVTLPKRTVLEIGFYSVFFGLNISVLP